MKTLKMRRSTRQKLSGVMLVLPAMLLILGMMLYPTLWSVRISLSSNSSVLRGNYSFVGLENFSKMITDDKLWYAIQNTVMFVVVTVVLE